MQKLFNTTILTLRRWAVSQAAGQTRRISGQGLRLFPLAILLAVLVSMVVLIPTVHADGFDVDDTGDVGDANTGDGMCDAGAGNCTLRAAIEEANALDGPDTITLTVPGPYNLTLGQINVASTITLTGNGETISAGGFSRVFYVGADAANILSLNGVTVRDGVADAGGGILIDWGGTLNILNSAILSNTATVQGGGINNYFGTLNIANSTIVGNRAYAHGGGIIHFSFGSNAANLTNVTITDNTADSDNSDGGNGGGIYASGTLFNFKNTIVAGNSTGATGDTAEPDCYGLFPVVTHGNNFIGASSATFPPGTRNGNDDFVGTVDSPLDPQFGPLTGSPAYYPLLAGSLAIDQIQVVSATLISSGSNPLFGDGDLITTDQVDNLRPQGTGYDIGAIETMLAYAGVGIAKTVTPTTPVVPGDTVTYTLNFWNLGEDIATGVVITDIVPITLTNVSVISSGVAISNSGASPSFVWNVADLGQNEGGIITITGRISTGLTGDTTFTNTASITTTAVDADGGNNQAQASVTVIPDPPAPIRHMIYLPVIVKNRLPSPDLLVMRILATNNSVRIVIENVGDDPVTDEFWVDVYIDPDIEPTRVNQTWPMVGDEGLVWGVTVPLQPGDVITLTVGDVYYWPELGQAAWPLQAGIPVYAQVDSANLNTGYGAVLETHEIRGGIYNNISVAQVSTTTFQVGGGGPAAESPDVHNLPPRP